ncbi:MAG: Calcium-binding EF-hand-containing protein [Pedosphaera sp.]|nr:Calcium-binding EF-hand-containing protein [Pedosphaera sp.]
MIPFPRNQRMERFIRKLGCLVLLWLVADLACAADAPARLALIVESPDTLPAADLLTVELSKNPQILLLERAQIEKVYHEQALTAGNKDYIKLGQILGADGLLILELTGESTNHVFTWRMVAVKPGVVLAQREYPWPLPEAESWAALVATQLQPLFPKLAVLPKDAVPISILNLRSAVQSPQGEALERELTLLLHNRLVREKHLFVLERRRMHSLTDEKELSTTAESAFWNGAYLLDGLIDKDGYAKDTVTISGRLVPPDKTNITIIEVTGRRADLPALINETATRILAGLREGAPSAEWKPAEEATQYYDEARWALKWGMLKEAQAASESAWALGKKDMDCALVRVKSYVSEVPSDMGGYLQAKAFNDTDSETEWQTIKSEISARYPLGVVFGQRNNNGRSLKYAIIDKAPDPKKIDQALYALGLYYEFSQTLPSDQPLWRSPWYFIGIDDLTAASEVLQYFHSAPESQKLFADKLAQLRALARSVVVWISKSPSVHNTYWVGDRLATHDELGHTVAGGHSFFWLELVYGCFWQEKPEDCVALYHDLMSSPAFTYIHGPFSIRGPEDPRLIAWNTEDQKRVPMIWHDFMQELNASTNWMLRVEGSFLNLADARDDKELKSAFDAIFSTIISNRNDIVSNSFELTYVQAETDELIYQTISGYMTVTKEELQHQYSSIYRPQLEKMDREYWNNSRLIPAQKQNQVNFEKVKSYLTSNPPFDYGHLSQLFGAVQYSRPQAAELLPLLSTYKSNLLEEVVGRTGHDKTWLQACISRTESEEGRVKLILVPPPSAITKTKPTNASNASAAEMLLTPLQKTPAPDSIPASNALNVKQFIKIPQDRLRKERATELRIFSHRLCEGKLWLDLRYQDWAFSGSHSTYRAALAIWNFENDTWSIIQCPDADESGDEAPIGFLNSNDQGLYFEMFNGTLYLSQRVGMKKYDFRTHQWETLKFPGQALAQLFAVNGHLYAANGESIFEILDGGQSSRLLASCRRRPAVSVLDSLESLGNVTLFPGPDNSLRAGVGNDVYTWDGHDWQKTAILNCGAQGEDSESGIILRSMATRKTQIVWFLPHDRTTAELCWQEPWHSPFEQMPPIMSDPVARAIHPALRPTWLSTNDFELVPMPGFSAQSSLYFYAECCLATNLAGHWKLTEQDGHHANLICLDHDLSEPIVIPLKFDPENAPPSDYRLRTELGNRPILDFRPSSWLVLTESNLLIGYEKVPGVWAIPRSEINATIAREKARLMSLHISNLEAQIPMIIGEYDRNGDRKLDPMELAALRKDALLLAGETSEKFAGQHLLIAPVITTNFPTVATLLKNYDTNGDRSLNSVELLAFARDIKKQP